MKKVFYISKKIQYECQEYLNGYLLWCSLASISYKKILPKYFTLFFQKHRLRLEDSLNQRVLNFYFLGKKALLGGNKRVQSYLMRHFTHMLFKTVFQFKKIIGLRGVGYKFSVYKNLLRLQVDYSHLLKLVFLPYYYGQFNRKFNWIRVWSPHVFSLTKDFALLRRLRRPDVYRGKGIRYAREVNFYKQGKKKKSI